MFTPVLYCAAHPDDSHKELYWNSAQMLSLCFCVGNILNMIICVAKIRSRGVNPYETMSVFLLSYVRGGNMAALFALSQHKPRSLFWSEVVPGRSCNQTSSRAGVEGALNTAVLVHQVCLRRWKHSLRLIPSDFLVTCWAKLCLMNALMGSVYCEECRTGCPRGSRFDIITQICQGQRALLLSALQNCLYHLHRHGYSDMNALLHGRRMTSKPPHPNDNTLCSAYRMKLMRDNDVATGAYVAWEAQDMTDFAFEGIKSGSVRPHRSEALPGAARCLSVWGRLSAGEAVKTTAEMFFLITARLRVLWVQEMWQHRGKWDVVL